MTEMRVEDYYLIRSKLLDNRVYGCLNKAIQG